MHVRYALYYMAVCYTFLLTCQNHQSSRVLVDYHFDKVHVIGVLPKYSQGRHTITWGRDRFSQGFVFISFQIVYWESFGMGNGGMGSVKGCVLLKDLLSKTKLRDSPMNLCNYWHVLHMYILSRAHVLLPFHSTYLLC